MSLDTIRVIGEVNGCEVRLRRRCTRWGVEMLELGQALTSPFPVGIEVRVNPGMGLSTGQVLGLSANKNPLFTMWKGEDGKLRAMDLRLRPLPSPRWGLSP